MDTTNTATRDRGNGQYAHSTFEKVCKCGHSLGEHSAETVNGVRECFHGDFHDGEPCDCTKFRKAK